MSNIWLISDTHFGHQNICKFTNEDGTKLRPWYNSDDMDEAMVENWNSVVKPKDKVYHLGDVVINRRCLPILNRLNGDKRLVFGNHDIFKHQDYLLYFSRVYGSHKLDNLILSHIPIHEDSISRWMYCNVHGHIHSKNIKSGKYFNVSVENINYTPVSLEDLKLKIRLNKLNYSVDLEFNDVNIVNNI